MFDHLKRVMGRVLGGTERNAIEEVFRPLSANDSRLPADVASFVTDGSPADVVARIGRIPDAADKVGILGGTAWSTDVSKFAAHKKLVATFSSWDPAALLRLTQVYQAATNSATGNRVTGWSVAGWHGPYNWLNAIVRQATNSSGVMWSSAPRPAPPITLAQLEAMAVANQQDPAEVARGALIFDPSSWGWGYYRTVFLSFSDFREMLERRAAVVRESFAHADYRVKVNALECIAAAKADPRLWLEELADLATASSKQVRQAAEPLVRSIATDIRPALERRAREGDNETRAIAVEVCHRVYGEEVRNLLAALQQDEKSKKVLEVIVDILRVADFSRPDSPAEDSWDLPALPVFPTQPVLSSGVRTDLNECLSKAYDEAKASYERIKHQKWAGKFEVTMSDDIVDRIFACIQSDSPHGVGRRYLPDWRQWRDGTSRIMGFAAHREFQLIHLVRWCIIWVGKPENHYWFHWCNPAFAAYAKVHGHPSLRDVAAAMAACGSDGDAVGRALLAQWRPRSTTLFAQSPEGIWPYFAERLHLLEAALGAVITAGAASPNSRYQERYERRNALAALSTFPKTPRKLSRLLWEIALAGAKAERADAQACLSREPDTEARLIATLNDGKWEFRTESASWLARLGSKDAVDPLLKALKKERNDLAKSAMMLALETLGVPAEKLVDRKALEAEAEKQAAKELPADLAWFPFSTLPSVRWSGQSSSVSVDLLRLLIVQACKLKNPEPGPLLRTYAGFFDSEDRARLGRFVLEAWLAQDTIPAHTPEEAAKLAEAQTQQMAQYYKQHPQWAATWNEQQHYRSIYNHLLITCKGSAINSKGVLAIAGACAPGSVAPIVHRYIKQWYGMRGAQCKALLQMLAWIDDPNAIQVLLAIGNRFRTKGIQEEAARLCQELAERKSWTLDELADRTIPTAGFDETGIMELDYGTRMFTARLNADFSITLLNPEGREISALPEANKSDNEEMASAAKKALSTARKELKAILKFQQERLYEAVCTQREWTFADLSQHLFIHPIVGPLCERLVWSIVDEGKTLGTFRPLQDKTLTNTDDDAITVAPEQRVRLTHEATVSATVKDAWLQHLADYKVEPLFSQFGKPAYVLPEDRREQTEVVEFRGHVVENFKLRGRLTKLGYTRGVAQDGGWFMDYNKRFPGLGIQATVNFSGSPLPEENKSVALLSLSFSRIGEDNTMGTADSGVPLGELPSVLLSECWNDLRLAAAEGKGFDPNWEKTVQY